MIELTPKALEAANGRCGVPSRSEIPRGGQMKKQLLTNSRAASFKSCRKKHWFEYEIGLRKQVDAKALRMGSAGHEALDAYKKTKNVEKAIDEVGK